MLKKMYQQIALKYNSPIYETWYPKDFISLLTFESFFLFFVCLVHPFVTYIKWIATHNILC